ncbi:MAG: undecaprenyl-diphosphate phosphatase [bacterium]|nr:undecaprenyl-diphosphate phosphatase [bacterium]
MSLLEAIVMGFIQGITEFLPVSSSGHLALFRIAFDIKEAGLLFDVILHLGTLIAIFAVYYKDIWKLITCGIGIVIDVCKNIGIFFSNIANKKKGGYIRIVSSGYRKFVMLIIVSTIPTAVIGFIARDIVEMAAKVLIVPGICLILTSILLLISDHCNNGEKLPKQVTYSNAFMIGIAQGIATLPGLSRSGTTITACLLSGFNRKFAVKYSFIMSIPVVLGSVILELGDFSAVSWTGGELANYIVGMLVAAVVGYICIKAMLYVVKQKKFTYFAIYCFIVGAISVGVYFYRV